MFVYYSLINCSEPSVASITQPEDMLHGSSVALLFMKKKKMALHVYKVLLGSSKIFISPQIM